MKQRRPTCADRAVACFRIYMGGSAIVTWYMARFEPRSMVYSVASTGEGALLAVLLMIVGFAAILDAVINDLLPNKYHWRVAKRQRHFILAAMAFCYAAQLYIAFFSVRSPGLQFYYLWNALAIMVFAFLDAHQRSKDASCAMMVCN